MPRGGGDCCMTKTERDIGPIWFLVNETFQVVPYAGVYMRIVRCLNPFPFGIGTDWIGVDNGETTQGN